MLPCEFSALFRSDIEKLKKEDKKLLSRVFELILDIGNNIHSPLTGIGKPEALRNNLSGFYSRRITDKHRLIYTVETGVIKLVSCYGHYSDS
jgi:toxin YoeB